MKSELCLLMAIIFVTVSFNLSICVKAEDVPAAPAITMSTTTLGLTDKTDVTIANGSTDPKAWVGIYNENDKPGAVADGGAESIWYGYLSDLGIQNGNGKFTLDLSTVSGLEAGESYKLILFKDDGYTIDASADFQTSSPQPPTPTPTPTNPQDPTPAMTISNPAPSITDKVDVTIANGSTDSKAWVGLYNENDKPGDVSDGGVESIWYGYLSDLGVQNGNGKFTLDLSDKGLAEGKNYKLVLFTDDGYTIDASVNFTTKAGTGDNPTPTNPNSNPPSLTMPNTLVGLMDTVEVDIANASTDPGAWIGAYNEDDKPGDASSGGAPSMWWSNLSDLNIQNGKFYLNLDNIQGRERGKTYKLILFRDSGYTIDASVEFKIAQPEVKKYSLEEVQVKTQVGTAPTLPEVVTEDNSDGTTSEVKVTWDNVDNYLYAKAGSFTVEGTVAGINEKARADVEVVDGDGPLYTFNLLSDTHLTSDLGFVHDLNFDYALKEMNKLDPNSSALIINGDTVDKGLEENWEGYSKILNQNKHPKVDLSLGNHDTWQENAWIDENEYAKSKENFLKYSGAPNVYYDDWINGNHFIFLGSEKSDGNTAYFSDDQLKWFDKTLAENAASNKPIFVFIHQPLHDTVAGSKDGQGCGDDLAQDTQVRQILAKYPQAILFTGHTHWEFGSKDVMYNAKYCTMINIPSCGYCWTDANTEDDISEGYYVEVYKDKVLVKGRNFTNREWDKTAQYEVNYEGTPQNALVSVQNSDALIAGPQLDKLSLTTDKDSLVLNGTDTAKLTLSGTMSDGSKADLLAAAVEYSSDNNDVATVNSMGMVTPLSVGTANITARVTINGVTESVTQQINVGKIKTNANLSGIALDGKALSNFAADTLKYTVTLPEKTSKVPVITAVAEDSDAAVTIKQAQNMNDTAVILVTSADGTVTKTYAINFMADGSGASEVESPVFSLDSSKTYTEKQSLSISCPTDGATIRYTTDGTDPDEKSSVYNGPIDLEDTTTVRAIAVKDGLIPSEIVSAQYNVKIPTGTEIIQNGDFSNGDTGWTHYNAMDYSPSGVENGEYKTTVGQLGPYYWSVQLNQGDFTLKKGVTYRFTFDARSTLNRSIEAMIFQHAGDNSVKYLDKIIPVTSNMNTYSFDFTMPADDSSVQLVFGMGNVDGLGYAESHDIYIDNVSLRDLPPITSAPTFSVENGTYSSPLKVAISSSTEGATIRYTTDGTDPTEASPVYNGPITVSSNTTVKAYAVKDGLAPSKIFGATYKFTPVAAPVFSIPSGSYSGPQSVQLATSTEGATIRYTTDGTNPTINSKVYSGPIVVSSNMTIKAYAVKDGHSDSSVVSASYSISNVTPTPPPYIPPTPTPQPQPETRDGSVLVGGSAVTLPITRTTDSNGVKTDTVQLSSDKSNEIVQAALKANSKTAVITIPDIQGDNADKVVINVTSDSMTQFINNGIGLIIATDKAKAELPIATMKDINGGDLEFEIDTLEDSSSLTEINNSISEVAAGAVTAGSSIDVKTNYSGMTKIIVPFKEGQVPSKNDLSSLAVMIKHSDGEITVDKGTIAYDEKGNPMGISVWVNKFSSFTLIKVPDGYFDGTTTVIPYKVNADKEWQIKFSKEADPSTINNENIYVIDSKGNRANIKISYGSDDILRIAPVGAYTSGETYYLYISKKVSSKDGTSLTNALKYSFTVE